MALPEEMVWRTQLEEKGWKFLNKKQFGVGEEHLSCGGFAYLSHFSFLLPLGSLTRWLAGIKYASSPEVEKYTHHGLASDTQVASDLNSTKFMHMHRTLQVDFWNPV